MALSRLPPRASRRSRRYSRSRIKPKVRARLTSLTNEVVEKSIAAACLRLLNTGWSKAIVKLTLKPSKGSKRAHLSSSFTITGWRIRINFLAAFCSSIPADWIRNTKGPALPSMIGTSGALTSTKALSMPKPAKADNKCSTVEIRTLPLAKEVESCVSPTLAGQALISTGDDKSIRLKTTPVSGAAGRKVR